MRRERRTQDNVRRGHKKGPWQKKMAKLSKRLDVLKSKMLLFHWRLYFD